MANRLDQLRQTTCTEIDTLAVTNLSTDPKALHILENAFMSHELVELPDYKEITSDYLLEIQHMPDFEIVQTLRQHYEIKDFAPNRYSDPNLIISKVNHGYWEHLAFLNAAPEHRETYRDVNLRQRISQYLSSDFMDILISSMLSNLGDDGVSAFISCTTGKENFAAALGAPWIDPTYSPGPYVLSPFKRGAVRGLLAFTQIAQGATNKKLPLGFYDSFENNKTFESGNLIPFVSSAAQEDTVCLIMGPPSLQRVRVEGWRGEQAFLGISSQHAMAQWRFNLLNLFTVLEHYAKLGRDVVILFQGAVLGPVIASFLPLIRAHLKMNVAFLDLGRLLDTAFGEDVTRTGSPLPNDGFDSVGQLVLAHPQEGIFQELLAHGSS